MFTVFGVLSIIFTSALNATLGLVVYIRNPKKDLNKAFLGMALGTALWTATSLISDNTDIFELSKRMSSLAFAFGFLGLFFVTLFTVLLKKKKLRYSFWIYFIPALIVAYIFSTSLVYDLTSLDDFDTGILYFPYISLLVVLLGFSVFNLIISLRKGNKEEKNQIKLVFIGIAVMAIGGLVFNALLPLVFPGSADIFTKVGPLFSVFFVGLTGYAIVKHKLFDFKAVLVRSFAYVISTGVFVLVYATSALLIKRLLFPDQQISTSQLVTNIVIMVILLSFYGKLTGTFNRVTNKIFYRDAYNPQELISRLNKTLVTNVNLDELLTKSALIIQEEMKTSFCTFYIRETSYFEARVLGAHRKLPEFDGIDEIQDFASKTHSKIFSAEIDTTSENDKKLAKLLKSNDVEVLARLTNTLDYEVKGIGYIFLGSKKSGSQFTSQDLKILEIIANELVIAIENVLRFEEIEQFNVTLQKKIDDATKELKQTNDKLRALDEAKDEFVSMASHQLRTPLTSIKGYLSMVLEGDAGKVNETQEKMLGQAFFSSQRMVYLISDLLNVSRLKTGKFVIESKPVYLPDVVESEINQLHEGANAKNLKLQFTKPKEFPTMNLDEMKLRQVIMNFSDNAIYYTPSGGKITIELKDTPKAVEFTVKDSGIGVPKEQQHKLFTKFFRADNARKARPDGTGLGLFMAKKVIIAQGGSMIFDSKLGKGSTFGFSFPKEKLLVTETTQKQSK